MASLNRLRFSFLILKRTSHPQNFKYSKVYFQFHALHNISRSFSQFSYHSPKSFKQLNNDIRKCSTKAFEPKITTESTSEQSTGSTSESNTSVSSGSPTEGLTTPQNIIPEKYIPDAPVIPDVSTADPVMIVGESSFASQGLGGWTPVGILENCLEYMHVSLDVPWWASIVIGTCIIRTLMFPLFIISQRNMIKMNRKLPQMQAIQLKLTEARRMGNEMMAAKYAHDLRIFMIKENINPLKNMIVPLTQAPVFISFFFALREMANLPVESFHDGGMLWFTNLSLADPYYLLPLITSATVFITIELGTEGTLPSQQMQLMRYVLRAIPIIIFPFTMNFPAAILCYWVTNNFISLGYVGLLRIEAVNKFFKIGKKIHHAPENLPIKPKGFVEGFREAMTNMKIAKNLDERLTIDEVRFRKSGLGAIQKTYPYDPTKQRSSSASASIKTKSRDNK